MANRAADDPVLNARAGRRRQREQRLQRLELALARVQPADGEDGQPVARRAWGSGARGGGEIRAWRAGREENLFGRLRKALAEHVPRVVGQHAHARRVADQPQRQPARERPAVEP